MLTKKLLFLITEGEYFCSHRLSLALEAMRQGYEVAVAAYVSDETRAKIQGHGIQVFAVPFVRASVNPLRELGTLICIFRIYRQWRPDIVHQVAFKPAIYGTLVARILRVPRIINAIAGLGIIFVSPSLKARILRPLILTSFHKLMRHPSCHLITQTLEDAAIVGQGLPIEQVKVIPGAGVDMTIFVPAPSRRIAKNGRCRAIMVSRILWSKGIGELVKAARAIKKEGLAIDIILVGEPDLANPDHVPVNRLKAWHTQKVITWLGRRDDIAALYQEADIAVFPSYYGEGVPKTLIEAAACGKPIVTTDHPGCRDVVVHGENGLLVSLRDVRALVKALRLLHDNKELCAAMGEASRHRALAIFSEDKIIQATVELYTKKSVHST
ncbi:MAG: glycosyltransferase family 4 protein [Alphaproteobacteria bacterium]